LKKTSFFVGVIVVIMFGMAGMYYSMSKFSSSFEGAQAKLSFGQLKRLRQIKSDLDKGCGQQAHNRLSHAIDEEKMLIAEYIQSNDDPELQAYITQRDSKLWKELKSYNVDWGKKWSISGCDESGSSREN